MIVSIFSIQTYLTAATGATCPSPAKKETEKIQTELERFFVGKAKKSTLCIKSRQMIEKWKFVIRCVRSLSRKIDLIKLHF